MSEIITGFEPLFAQSGYSPFPFGGTTATTNMGQKICHKFLSGTNIHFASGNFQAKSEISWVVK